MFDLKDCISNEEEEKLSKILNDKMISILGDSISTYIGISNSSEENNEDNAIYYRKQILQEDTYWQQIITKFNMKLCVNNSWSGSYATMHVPNAGEDYACSKSPGIVRSKRLTRHDGVRPDVIIVFIGINDFNGGVSNVDFDPAYNKIIDNLNMCYPQAIVFCVNMPNRNVNLDATDFNNSIEKAVNRYDNMYLVDLFNSEYSKDTYETNSIDNLHPNEIGMDYLSRIIIQRMRDVFLNNQLKKL